MLNFPSYCHFRPREQVDIHPLLLIISPLGERIIRLVITTLRDAVLLAELGQALAHDVRRLVGAEAVQWIAQPVAVDGTGGVAVVGVERVEDVEGLLVCQPRLGGFRLRVCVLPGGQVGQRCCCGGADEEEDG